MTRIVERHDRPRHTNVNDIMHRAANCKILSLECRKGELGNDFVNCRHLSRLSGASMLLCSIVLRLICPMSQ